MKKFFWVILIGFISSGFAAGSKIGYVDIKKIFEGYEKAKKTEEMFKKEVGEEQKNIDKMQEEIKKMQEEYEKKKNLMKDEERQKKENELRTKIQEFSKKYTEVNQKLDERRKQLEEQIFNEIKKAISDYGKKNGYTVILDSRLILYGEEASDLTEEVIKLLNK